jgi:3-deoxy-manno-octulosonate cytidylyltransferase (CMP-KDO synthetase)
MADGLLEARGRLKAACEELLVTRRHRGAFRIVIPARYGSSRLPGKPLHEIAGKPMIVHVWEKARSSGAEEVIVATDDERIAAAARQFGAHVELTRPDHASGTDRIAELADRLAWDDDRIVVNVQGDEPLMPPALPAQVAELLAANAGASIATLWTPFADEAERMSPNTAKVVVDRHGMALYFSRAVIPHRRDGGAEPLAKRHVGLYAYRARSLIEIAQAPPCELEQSERLEQLRALYLALPIVVAAACDPPPPGAHTDAALVATRARNAGARI